MPAVGLESGLGLVVVVGLGGRGREREVWGYVGALTVLGVDPVVVELLGGKELNVAVSGL